MSQAADKGHSISCRTAFAVERDILARVVPSRASSMGPTTFIPHGKSMLGEDCSLWLERSAPGVEGVAGVCVCVCVCVCIC